MNISEIKRHQASIGASQKKLAVLLQHRDRAIEAASIGEDLAIQKALLVKQRADAAARAFINKSEADHQVIDAQIDALDQRAAEALVRSKTASDAIALLDSEIASLEEGIASAERAKLQVALAAADEWFHEVQQDYLRKGVEDLFQHLAQLEAAAIDLLPPNRTILMEARSINMENDGHEEESIHRAADHWFPEASRVGPGGQGGLSPGRFQ
ncbi:MAG: hypothetical protein QM749_03450 [Aquabacterium sp.]